MTRKIIASLSSLLFLAVCITAVHAEDIHIPKTCQSSSQDFNQALGCAQKYFVANGEPINPMIIKDLGTFMSDSGEQVVAINLLDSQNSNKYYFDAKDYKRENYGNYFSSQVTLGKDGKGFFKYAVEGLTKNGVYVLQTWENQGGSGTFSNLLFVRIRKDMGFVGVENNKLTLNRKRILIEKLSEFHVRDQAKANVKIEDDTITVILEQPNGQKSTSKFTISLGNE